MTIPQYRAHEPLYLIIVRDKNDHPRLAEWAKRNDNSRGLDGNRLHLYDCTSLSRFQMYWEGNWSMTIIWDCWNRRHIENI